MSGEFDGDGRYGESFTDRFHYARRSDYILPGRFCNAYRRSGQLLCMEYRRYDGCYYGFIFRQLRRHGNKCHRVFGEFDGKIKYGRLLRPGHDAGQVVFAEKRREDLVRELTRGSMVRLVWEDLDRPRVTHDRIARLLRLAG